MLCWNETDTMRSSSGRRHLGRNLHAWHGATTVNLISSHPDSFLKTAWVTAFIGHKRLNPNLFNDSSRNCCLLFASDTLRYVCCSKTTVRCCPLVVKKWEERREENENTCTTQIRTNVETLFTCYRWNKLNHDQGSGSEASDCFLQ